MNNHHYAFFDLIRRLAFPYHKTRTALEPEIEAIRFMVKEMHIFLIYD